MTDTNGLTAVCVCVCVCVCAGESLVTLTAFANQGLVVLTCRSAASSSCRAQ